MLILKGCKQCNYLTEADTCPLCGNPTFKDWQGYLVIVDYTKSEIAKKTGTNVNGRFALKVRG
jgi:DNA-directed RNA polymerase subunit E"